MYSFGITDTGKVRKDNQDKFAVEDINGVTVLVVCDGMGGEKAGNLASSIAVDAFMDHIRFCLNSESTVDFHELLREASGCANIKVYDRAYSDINCKGMGSTIVGALVKDGHAIICNIGDSRAYLIAESKATLLTHDHSFVQQLVDQGSITPEQAKKHPHKNIITRALGSSVAVMTDIFEYDIRAGEVLLLCTDGMSNVIEDTELFDLCSKYETPEEICQGLLELTLERGAPDNVTIVTATV